MSKKKKKPTTKKAIPAQSLATSNTFWSNTKLQSILIFAVAFLLYANTLKNGYTQDDSIVITDNMYTTDGISGISGILSKDTFFGFFKVEGKSKLVSGGRYRPLTLVMFAIGYELFGESPLMGHLMNILWFGLTCLVLYWLLLRLFNFDKNPEYAGMIAFCTSLLFAAHPIHTEVVANIKGRDEIIALLGSLTALFFALKSYQEKKPMLNFLAVGIFFLALFSKENVITFLAIIPITFWVFTKAKMGDIVKTTVPFVLAAIGFLVVRGSILGWSMGEAPIELMNNPFVKVVGDRYVPFTASEELSTIFYTLGYYVKLLFIPHPLTHDYYPRHIDMMSFGDVSVIMSLIGYVGALGWSLWATFKRNPLGYAVLFYLSTLSVVSNLAFPVGTNMAERLVFMPSVGFCLFLVLGLTMVIQKGKSEINTKITPMVIGLICLIFGALTVNRNFAWKDNYTLFTTDIETSKNSAKLNNAVAGELLNRYGKLPEGQRNNGILNKAVGHLNQAVQIHPNYKNAYLLLGNAHNYLKNYEQSIQYYNKSLSIDPGYSEANNNLAITYREAGQFYGEKKGDLNKSLQYLTKANSMNPSDPEVIRLLGVANGIAGNHAQAISFFKKLTELQPNNAKAFFNLGSAYYHAGDAANADLFHNKARNLNPNVEQEMRGN